MQATILNAGENAWIFEEFATRLSQVLAAPVSETPAAFNYVLGWSETTEPSGQSFIPFRSILLASDKRHMARAFNEHGVSAPQTFLLDSPEEAIALLHHESNRQWVLKWPTGCGGSGHRLMTSETDIPDGWPQPYVLQEFIRLNRPEVYRLYCAGGETFGWNVRRFAEGSKTSPFVAHAQGAHYEDVGKAPPEAETQARLALEATNLLSSFGCADLMQDENGTWRVLEVNTDGIFNHVDRDTLPHIAQEIDERLIKAWQKWLRQREN